MAKPPPQYLINMLSKYIDDVVEKSLAEQTTKIQTLEAQLVEMTRRALAAEGRLTAVSRALGSVTTSRTVQASDLRTVAMVATEEPTDQLDEPSVTAPESTTTSEPSPPRPQPSVSGAHLSAEQKRLRSEVISQFHERRKSENVPVSSLGPALGLPPSRSYALYDQWCKETGVTRAKPPPWRRNRKAK